MKDNPATTATVSDPALELVMRDVLDGLFELSLESSLCTANADFEILEIRQPENRRPQGQRLDDMRSDTKIIDFPNLRQACG